MPVKGQDVLIRYNPGKIVTFYSSFVHVWPGICIPQHLVLIDFGCYSLTVPLREVLGLPDPLAFLPLFNVQGAMTSLQLDSRARGFFKFFSDNLSLLIQDCNEVALTGPCSGCHPEHGECLWDNNPFTFLYQSSELDVSHFDLFSDFTEEGEDGEPVGVGEKEWGLQSSDGFVRFLTFLLM